MASEAILKELFEASKASVSFKGMSAQAIWQACLKYKEKPDSVIRSAINILRERDQKALKKSQLERDKLEKGREKMAELHKIEASDREQDVQNAEKILEGLFES